MAKSFIPWHVFFEALRKSKTADLDAWLDRWRFTDDGAVLTHEHEGDNKKALSWKGKGLAQLRLIMGKGSKTVH